MKTLKVKPLMTVEQSDALAGSSLTPLHVKQLVVSDTDIYDAESGKCLAKYRKNVIPPGVQLAAYKNLLHAATLTDSNRGTAGGKGTMQPRVLKSGVISKTLIAPKTEMGLAGYFDRSVRFPNCRLTAFNRHHLEKFKAAYPIIKLVDNKYAELMPEEYELQRKMANRTSKDFVIPDTAFTTVTVNKNWQSAVHKDQGDFKQGFGNLLALRNGTYTGGWLCMPRWGIGFDLCNGDLLMMDVHQWHGNTPIFKDDPKAVRLSLVMYYREKMIHCGTMAEELKRVQNRKRGDEIYTKSKKK